MMPSMPTVLRWRGYRFHFYSREPDEPPHVHVTKAGAQAKIWLSDCTVARSVGYPDRELSERRRKVRAHRDELLKAWHDYFRKP